MQVGQRGADSANIVAWQGSPYACGEYVRCCADCIVDVVCVVDIDARSVWVLLAHFGGTLGGGRVVGIGQGRMGGVVGQDAAGSFCDLYRRT